MVSLSQFVNTNKIIYTAGVESVKEYDETSRVISRNAQIRLTISPFFLPGVPLELSGTNFGGLVTKVSWNKDRQNAFGQFKITFVADEDRFAEFGKLYPIADIQDTAGPSARDIFKIRTLGKLDVNGYHVMTGLLFDLYKTTVPGTSRLYEATFYELGYVLQQETLDHRYRGLVADYPWGTTRFEAFSMSVPEAINYLLWAYLKRTLFLGLKSFPNLTYLLSDGVPIGKRINAAPPPLGAISHNSWLNNTPLTSGMFDSGNTISLWNYLKQISTPPFMELFTDSGGRTMVTGRLIKNPAKVASSVFSSARSVASIFGEWTERFNESNLDLATLAPGFSHVVFRSTPYENPTTGIDPFYPSTYDVSLGIFDLLVGGDFIIVSDRDIINKRLGTSEDQQYTFFDVGYTDTGITRYNNPVTAKGPIVPWYPGGVKTFGSKLYNLDIDITSSRWGDLISGEKAHEAHWLPFGLGPTINNCTQPVMSGVLGTWFRNQSKYMQGTITTRAFPYARPGMLLLYLPDKNGKADDPRELGVYYIESMAGEVNYGEIDTTTFNVIRGTPVPWDTSSLARLLLDWEWMTPVEPANIPADTPATKKRP